MYLHFEYINRDLVTCLNPIPWKQRIQYNLFFPGKKTTFRLSLEWFFHLVYISAQSSGNGWFESLGGERIATLSTHPGFDNPANNNEAFVGTGLAFIGQLMNEFWLSSFEPKRRTKIYIFVFLPYLSKIDQIKKIMQIIILEDK